MTDRRPLRDSRTPRLLDLRAVVVILLVAAPMASILYDIPGEIGRWKLAVAREQYRRGQRDVAIESVDEALRWAPREEEVILQRLDWLDAQGNLQGALQVADAALKAHSDNVAAQMKLLQRRLSFLQRLGRHAEAIRDANQLVELGPEQPAGPHPDRLDRASLLNARAYTIARAAAAGEASQEQVINAIADMQTVLQAMGTQRDSDSWDDLSFRLAYWEKELMYLDTLAYLQLAAGAPRTALRNFNRCVQMCEFLLPLWESYSGDGIDTLTTTRIRRGLLVHLAVILHHRGETFRALGNEEAARRDIETAKRLGYNRADDIW